MWLAPAVAAKPNQAGREGDIHSDGNSRAEAVKDESGRTDSDRFAGLQRVGTFELVRPSEAQSLQLLPGRFPAVDRSAMAGVAGDADPAGGNGFLAVRRETNLRSRGFPSAFCHAFHHRRVGFRVP